MVSTAVTDAAMAGKAASATEPSAEVQQKTKRRGKVTTINIAPTPQPQSLAIGSPIVRPVTTVDEQVESWKEYEEICRRILDPETDYIYSAHYSKLESDGTSKPQKPQFFRTEALAKKAIERYQNQRFVDCYIKAHKKRSAWDKLARFYGLSTPIEGDTLCQVAEVSLVGDYIVESIVGKAFKMTVYQDSKTLMIQKVSAMLAIVSPNGRMIIGDGACATSERRNGSDSFSHADHDVFATAFTRAFNRGVSRCIGTGEVSAEEFVAEPAEPTTVITVVSAPGQVINQNPMQPAQDAKAGQSASMVQAQAAPAVAVDLQPAKSVPVTQTATEEQPAEPPKAHIPNAEEWLSPNDPNNKQQSLPAQAPTPPEPTKVEPTTSGAQTAAPSPATAAPLFSDRFKDFRKLLFGNMREDRTIEYLFFAWTPAVSGPVEIERNGKFYPDAWTNKMKQLEDRAKRLSEMEASLRVSGKDVFLQFAHAAVEDARKRRFFKSV